MRVHVDPGSAESKKWPENKVLARVYANAIARAVNCKQGASVRICERGPRRNMSGDRPWLRDSGVSGGKREIGIASFHMSVTPTVSEIAVVRFDFAAPFGGRRLLRCNTPVVTSEGPMNA